MKKLKRIFLSTLILSGLLTTIPVTPSYAAGLSGCSDGAGVTSNVTITASHGNAFYIDSGVSPKLDAGYVGYKVTNNSGATKKGLWVSLTNFTGGKVSLANIDDQYMALDDIPASGTKIVYFLLKASGSSASAQNHLVSVYDKRLDLSGAALQRSCTYSFSAVKETIKASANKVEDNAGDGGTNGAIVVSDTTPELGQQITINVEGKTGQIGAGGVPDYDSIWLTPAAVSSWPTNALRLTGVSIKFDGNNNGWPANPQYTDQLLITNTNGLTEVDSGYYIATYTFLVIGKPASSVSVVPVAQIASGTQMKHSDTTASGSTSTITFSSFTIPSTLAKSVTSTTSLRTGTVSTISGASPGVTYVEVPYQLVLSTTGSATTIDEVVDTPGVGAIYSSGTGLVTDSSRTTVAIDAIYVSSESNLSPRPYHFVGPFTFSSSRTLVISYKMWLPATGATFVNNAYALVGTQKIGSSSSAIPNVSVATTSGTGSVTATTGTTTLTVTATTDAASSVTATGAVMNATIDPNTVASTIKFQYGTNASLSTVTETVTATTPGSGSSSSADPISASYTLTGLTQGTTYYYRVVVYSSSGAVLAQGDIVSFTTLVVAADPSPTTLAASSITSTGATLNGNISPNNTLVTRILFEYDTGTSLSGSTSYVVLQDTSVSPAVDIQTSGTDLQAFSTSLTGLTSGQTYSFRIIACTGSLTGSNPCGGGTAFFGSVLQFNLSKSSQVITFATIDNKTYGDANFTATTSSNSNLEVSVSSSTTSVCTIATSFDATTKVTTITITILSVGDCILTATQDGNATYNSATPVVQSFAVQPATLTVTAEDKSITAGSSTPTFTSTVSGFKGSDSASVSSAVYTFSGKSGYSYSPSTTAPTSAGIYSNEPSSATLTYSAGSASNYVISYVAGTYTINAASKSNQSIVLDDYSNLNNGSTINLDTLISNGGSGTGAITYAVTSTSGGGSCSISGSTLTAGASSGSCVVNATKAADSNYNQATDTGTITLTGPTYSITINSATGGSATTSAATVTSGGSVTLTATASSGYTFTSWSCTGGGSLNSSTANPATLSNITANATCTPTFTANAPSGGTRNNTPAINSGSKKIVVTRVSNELNAQVSNNQKPVFVGTNSTFTPGNSVNQTQTVANSTSATTSNTGGIVAVVTNTTQSPEAASNSAVVSAANTTAQTEVSRNSNVPAAVSVNRDENSGKIAVTATNGWTGRLSVAVVDNSSGEAVESYVEVVIAPTPAVTPQINLNPPTNPFLPPAPATPNRPTLNTGITINWQPSTSEVTGYIVTINEKVACVSSTTSCVINQIVGPKSKVEVFAQGNDNTFSPPVVVPEFKPAAPIPGLVVYFPLASSRITKAEVKKLDEFVAAMKVAGLNRVELQGHTDIQGTAKGYDNQTLSKNRANVVANYLRKNLKVITRKDQFADTKPAVLGTGEPVFQNNRRTEVLVW